MNATADIDLPTVLQLRQSLAEAELGRVALIGSRQWQLRWTHGAGGSIAKMAPAHSWQVVLLAGAQLWLLWSWSLDCPPFGLSMWFLGLPHSMSAET